MQGRLQVLTGRDLHAGHACAHASSRRQHKHGGGKGVHRVELHRARRAGCAAGARRVPLRSRHRHGAHKGRHLQGRTDVSSVCLALLPVLLWYAAWDSMREACAPAAVTCPPSCRLPQASSRSRAGAIGRKGQTHSRSPSHLHVEEAGRQQQLLDTWAHTNTKSAGRGSVYTPLKRLPGVKSSGGGDIFSTSKPRVSQHAQQVRCLDSSRRV